MYAIRSYYDAFAGLPVAARTGKVVQPGAREEQCLADLVGALLLGVGHPRVHLEAVALRSDEGVEILRNILEVNSSIEHKSSSEAIAP